MDFYGDQTRGADPRPELEALRERATLLSSEPPGPRRHDRWVALWLDAAALAQGIVDLDFADAQVDRPTPIGTAAIRMVLDLSEPLVHSFTGRFESLPPSPWTGLDALLAARLPSEVRCNTLEGFAFYAVYPEAYVQAVRGRPPGAPKVLGIRSIGLPLAAVVAAAAGGAPPVTVRPIGHPFIRRLSISPALHEELLRAGPDGRHAIVDEGPGLSGSSFTSVAEYLEAHGVPLERVDLFPSHAGPPGPEASPIAHRVFRRARRFVVEPESLLLSPLGPLSLARDSEVGAATAPIERLGAGAWRQRVFRDEAAWPAVNPQLERRKYLVTTARGRFLFKFAGLGRYGAERFALAQALAGAGFAPEAVDLVHGFLVQRWLDEAEPLPAAAIDRRALLAQVGAYLAFRARAFPVPAPGATPQRLLSMARTNTAEALGEDALARWRGFAEELGPRLKPIRTDNRMHAWEWLVLPGERVLKADAVDHHAAHDLIGCQDLAWDLAGAVVELSLTEPEWAELAGHVARSGGPVPDPEVLAFHLHCYLAFQLGALTLAAAAAPEEQMRIAGARARYGRQLRRHLEGRWPVDAPG